MLPDDAQLAAVIARAMASQLEKQDLRVQNSNRSLTAAETVGYGSGLLIPGVGLATAIGTHKTRNAIHLHEREQTARVSLSLLHDAGYSLQAAPEACRTLGTPEGKQRKGPPEYSELLLENLGTTWRSTLQPDPPAPRD